MSYSKSVCGWFGWVVAGRLLAPTLAPWLWAVGLGLGMPSVGLGVAVISLRADQITDTAAAPSSMVQGIGYVMAGAVTLGAGILAGRLVTVHLS